MGNEITPPEPTGSDGIEPIDLKSALEERYLAYALSTIMGRALPDDVQVASSPIMGGLRCSLRNS